MVSHFPGRKSITALEDYYDSQAFVDFAIEKEVVTPRKFVDERGRRYLIGMTREVQEQIGLPFDAFENLQKENKELREAVHDLSFWQRVKLLFLGKKFFKHVQIWH
jgi:hypothetical protein